MTEDNPKYLGDMMEFAKYELHEIFLLMKFSDSNYYYRMSVFKFYFKLGKVRFPHSGCDNKQKIMSSITNMNSGDFSLFLYCLPV